MRSLAELLEDARLAKSAQALKNQKTSEVLSTRTTRVLEAIHEATSSPALVASMAAHSTDDTEEIATKIIEKVVDVMLDDVGEFINICTQRGLTKTRIRKAVSTINAALALTTSTDYEVQLKEVAAYMQQHPEMYDTLGVLFKQ